VDGSGRIEFKEFMDLMRGMNPKEEAKQEETGGGGAFGGLGGLSAGLGSLAGGMGASMTAMSVLDAATKVRMNPMQMGKAGVVIQNMQGAGYSNEQINDVCRALVAPRPHCALRSPSLLLCAVLGPGRGGHAAGMESV